jgi:uncharacterized protein YceK
MVAALDLNGSASLMGSNDPMFYPGVYPGMRFAQEARPEWKAANADASLFALADFPFSLAFDTALLVWDLPWWAFHRS